ncbi:hypothetical protein BS50DRAFT_573412 [Corynespora cassiicola Philippines]|uniref:Uncharacterized protein n=1 Tax=Corynespora cassiicola Philippines TaxID=1448308 RepID=A0A2T2NSV4_CORCC|nr:hypothetical protein BS50DRAFT_573412 [Corynespora cassiicola Philippines]
MMSSYEDTPARPSKFKEGTMDSRRSIHPPPDELWRGQGLEIDSLIDKFTEENATRSGRAVSGASGTSGTSSSSAGRAAASTSEGTGALGRLSRALTSFFSGTSFSSLGKRKAGAEAAVVVVEKEDRREQAQRAYQQAKELGLLPTPKVFVRPQTRVRNNNNNNNGPAVLEPSSLPATPTPMLYKSPSKRDLHKQRKLSKRVSDLEAKLAEARKELTLVLSPKSERPLRAISDSLPPTPKSALAPSEADFSPKNPPSASSRRSSRVVKKRKTGDVDGDYEVGAESDVSVGGSEYGDRQSGRGPERRRSSRLSKKKQSVTLEKVITVVPDGTVVPPLPAIPQGVEGKKAAVRDDGYGGLGHEIF